MLDAVTIARIKAILGQVLHSSESRHEIEAFSKYLEYSKGKTNQYVTNAVDKKIGWWLRADCTNWVLPSWESLELMIFDSWNLKNKFIAFTTIDFPDLNESKSL